MSKRSRFIYFFCFVPEAEDELVFREVSFGSKMSKLGDQKVSDGGQSVFELSATSLLNKQVTLCAKKVRFRKFPAGLRMTKTPVVRTNTATVFLFQFSLLLWFFRLLTIQIEVVCLPTRWYIRNTPVLCTCALNFYEVKVERPR